MSPQRPNCDRSKTSLLGCQCIVSWCPQQLWSLADEEAQPHSSEASLPEQADTAVFYSISSTQKGLAGVDLGNFLIKQVAQRVLAEFPNVQMLVTLSPIPGFRAWLHTQVDTELTSLEQADQQARLHLCAVSHASPTEWQSQVDSHITDVMHSPACTLHGGQSFQHHDLKDLDCTACLTVSHIE